MSEMIRVREERVALVPLAVEVEPPHIYIDAPGLDAAGLDGLRGALSGVEGVAGVAPVDLLPGARRRMHLDALLDALADPVLAVDGAGRVERVEDALRFDAW